MKKTKQIERIEKMEKLMDDSILAIRELEKSFNRYLRAQKKIDELSDYYFSRQWRKDYEDDEKGKLPQELKRGVLSEDGLYNMFIDNDELIKKMDRFIRKQNADIKIK